MVFVFVLLLGFGGDGAAVRGSIYAHGKTVAVMGVSDA